MPESDAQVAGGNAFDVLAVIVLYKMRLSESPAFKTLMAARSVIPRETEIRVLLYDNSPNACNPGTLPVGVRYEAAQRNAGLAAAYNRALAIAEGERTTWILTLDQDTTLPVNFLLQMRERIRIVESNDRVAAIVPYLADADRPLSPVVVRFFGEHHVSGTFTGISEQEIRGLNSASLFRVSALKTIGGYDPYFWLDYVDTCIFESYICREEESMSPGTFKWSTIYHCSIDETSVRIGSATFCRQSVHFAICTIAAEKVLYFQPVYSVESGGSIEGETISHSAD